MKLGSYEIDLKKVTYGIAGSVIVGVSVGYAFSAMTNAAGSCNQGDVSSDSFCSLYGFYDDSECPPGYTSFFQTCVDGFSLGAGAIFNSIKSSVTYTADGWPLLNDESVFRIICNNFPAYNATQYPNCGPIHTTSCVNAAWEGFVAAMQVPCAIGAAHAAKVVGAVTGTLAGLAGTSLTFYKATTEASPRDYRLIPTSSATASKA